MAAQVSVTFVYCVETAVVAVECECENKLIPKLSNGSFSCTLKLNPDFTVKPLFRAASSETLRDRNIDRPTVQCK